MDFIIHQHEAANQQKSNPQTQRDQSYQQSSPQQKEGHDVLINGMPLWQQAPYYYPESSYVRSHVDESSPLKNITWSDPEGVVTFGSQKSGNATWGIDEFFSLQVLDDDRAGYCPDSCLSISVLMEVYGDVDIDSHPLTKAIESAAAQEDLIALANSELTLITRTLPGSKAHLKAGEEFTYQDSLLKQRFHPTTPGSVAYVHKHAP